MTFARCLKALIVFFCATAPSFAQPFPSQSLRVIVPFPVGGAVDEAVRIVGGRMAEATRQNFVIDNRPGASGNIGTEFAARAIADGHTLLATSVPLVVNPALFGKPGYDVARDFAPVSLLAAAPFVLVVHPSLPVDDVKGLIGYLRVRPGELHYASSGNGTNPHVAAELFRSLAKLDIVHVPYKGGAPALAALAGREAQLAFIDALPAAQQAKWGRLRALGVTSSRRFPVLAELPTLAESGLPGYEFTSWYGVLAPRTTPADRVAALNGHFRNALRATGMSERFAQAGAEVIASTQAEFGQYLQAELAKWARVAKETGSKAR